MAKCVDNSTEVAGSSLFISMISCAAHSPSLLAGCSTTVMAGEYISFQ